MRQGSIYRGSTPYYICSVDGGGKFSLGEHVRSAKLLMVQTVQLESQTVQSTNSLDGLSAEVLRRSRKAPRFGVNQNWVGPGSNQRRVY